MEKEKLLLSIFPEVTNGNNKATHSKVPTNPKMMPKIIEETVLSGPRNGTYQRQPQNRMAETTIILIV